MSDQLHGADADAPVRVARESGLVPAGGELVVMLSGGADSTCLLEVARGLGARVQALHVDHGLRPDSGVDVRHCRELCEHLGVPLRVERARPPRHGNLQAQAREARYALAEGLALEADTDFATAHTLSDQAETVLYRLATSPGSRALRGMAPRRGRLVRPLLGASRAETRAFCRARGLRWREDASNSDPRFARARVRDEVMPVLDAVGPAAERTIAETARQLRDEADVLDAAALQALGGPGAVAVSAAELEARPPALRRLALRRLAEAAAGAAVSLSTEQAGRILALAGGRGGSASLEVGGGLRAVVEYGTVRFARAGAPDGEALEPVRLSIPGSVAFGEWEVRARRAEPGAPSGGLAQEPLLDPGALGAAPLVRAWRAGDRLRPAGLDGTKALQDLFTDAKVPRELRGTLPIVEVDGEIAWVAGLAAGERFRASSDASAAVALSARRRPPDADPADG